MTKDNQKSKKSGAHKRSIGKTGNVDSPSYFITIPIEIVREMGWRKGQKVQVKKSRGKVIIEGRD